MAEAALIPSNPWSRLRRRLGKAWADHVYRSSESVVLECRREWIRAGLGKTTGLSFVTATDPGALPPLCDWLSGRAPAFQDMCRAGKVGLFVLRDGAAVGCAWLALSDHHDPASREFYAVRPGEAYHYCWLVEPAERRRGGGLALARYALHVMQELGIERQFGVIDRDNRASYQVQRHFGYRECGIRVRHFHLFHQRWTRVSSYTGTLGLNDTAGARAR
ncbi:GNAT family N-acetyltransferase [Sphingomonas sp.]|uniref:GNAT family N-acetyltransferase n=1 Tax=Sphingomonas sp. TaxID=28214 RepID=UPI0035C7C280